MSMFSNPSAEESSNVGVNVHNKSRVLMDATESSSIIIWSWLSSHHPVVDLHLHLGSYDGAAEQELGDNLKVECERRSFDVERSGEYELQSYLTLDEKERPRLKSTKGRSCRKA